MTRTRTAASRGASRDRLPLRSEAVVQRQALKILRAHGVDVQRRNTRTLPVVGKGGRERLMYFGTPGDPDSDGQLPDGRRFQCEFKREGWRPPGPRTKAYARWAKQLARLRKTNSMGGVALWIDRPEILHEVVPKLLAGARVEIDADGRCWVTDEDPGGGSNVPDDFR